LQIEREDNSYVRLTQRCHITSAHDINTSKHLISKIAQADLTKEAEHHLQMGEKMRKRVNPGGMHIGTSTSHGQTIDITLPAKLDSWSAAMICLKAAHAKQRMLSENEHLAFCEFFEHLKKLGIVVNESRTQSDGNKRFISSRREGSLFCWPLTQPSKD
jgi:hypothetical protein